MRSDPMPLDSPSEFPLVDRAAFLLKHSKSRGWAFAPAKPNESRGVAANQRQFRAVAPGPVPRMTPDRQPPKLPETSAWTGPFCALVSGRRRDGLDLAPRAWSNAPVRQPRPRRRRRRRRPAAAARRSVVPAEELPIPAARCWLACSTTCRPRSNPAPRWRR